MKNKGYAKFGGWGLRQIRCIVGDVQLAYLKLGRLLFFLTVSSYSRQNVAGRWGRVEKVTF